MGGTSRATGFRIASRTQKLVLRIAVIRTSLPFSEENNRMAENIRTAVEYETKRQERKSKRPLVRLKKSSKKALFRVLC